MDIIFFHADWCGKCKIIEQMVNEVSFEYGLNFIDANANKTESVTLFEKYNVNNLPVIILVDNNKTKIIEGLVSKEELVNEIKRIKE